MAIFKDRVLWGSSKRNEWVGSSIGFSFKMILAAAASLLVLCFVLVVVARLDVAFFESNGMAANPELREAFYYQVFELDGTIAGMLLAGFIAVGVTAFLFSKSQFDYFRHLSTGFRQFIETGNVPSTVQMGRFDTFATRFFKILHKRINGEKPEALDALLAEAATDWPKEPSISWTDQLQFVVLSGLLGAFFSTCCVMIYLKVSGRVVELAGQLVHYKAATGPNFLTEQFNILDMVIWALLVLTVALFVAIGYRFGLKIAQADYAVLRDMKSFMDGNFKQRLFLRRGDPAREFIDPMNKVLDEVVAKLPR